MHLKKILNVLLCVALSCSLLVGCGQDNGADVYTAPEYKEINFNEMGIDNYDSEAMEAALADIVSLCSENNSLKKMKEDYDTIVYQFDCLSTDENISYLYYVEDVTNDENYETHSKINELYDTVSDEVYTALNEVLHSQYREDMITYINDEGLVAYADDYVTRDQTYMDLLSEEIELTSEYDNLLLDENATITDFEQLYLDLLDNRIAQMAYIDGYDSYADYQYDLSYYRDFDPDDLEDFRQWAKEEVMPAYIKTMDAWYDIDKDAYYDMQLSQEEIINRAEPYISTVSENAATIFENMVQNNLVDLTQSDVKAGMCFTTSLYCYGSEYIFYNSDGSTDDIEGLIHEFGHYYEGTVNMRPSMYKQGCYDVYEIDSQGLEMLMLKYADEIFGDVAKVNTLETISDKLGVIIDGCVFDEFQQEAFKRREEGTLTTPEQVSELFLSIEKEYYGDYADYGWGDRWYIVGHTYNSPFYYISYATSAAAAFSLFSVELEDYDKAVNIYNDLINMGSEEGYVNTIETLNLPNPFTKEGGTQIMDGVNSYIESNLLNN